MSGLRPASTWFRLCALCVLATLTVSACAGNRQVTSAKKAERIAVDLANDLCQRDSGKRPFRTGVFPATQSDGRWLWGWLDPASAAGYSAQVSFRTDRSNPAVSLSTHATAQPDIEDPNAPSLAHPMEPARVSQLPDSASD